LVYVIVRFDLIGEESLKYKNWVFYENFDGKSLNENIEWCFEPKKGFINTNSS
jgi:hypothetical protein